MILEELKKVSSHPTADEVYDLVRGRLPRISLGTVYRNLEIMAAVGLVLKLEMGGTQKRFDGRVDEHYHVRCLDCGRVDDWPGPPIADIEDIFNRNDRYRVTGYRMELLGQCMECMECKNAPPPDAVGGR